MPAIVEESRLFTPADGPAGHRHTRRTLTAELAAEFEQDIWTMPGCEPRVDGSSLDGLRRGK
jgi:hypothetical protein